MNTESLAIKAARWALVAAVLANMAIQMLLAASKDTPTYDEPFHVGAAMEKYNGDLQWGADHPPFAHLLLGLPLQFVDFDPPKHSKQQIDYDGYVRGRDYLYQKDGAAHAARVIWLARLPIMIATLGTMLVLFLFARDFFGFWGGLLSLVLASANPSVLAHGRLATTDMVLTGLTLGAIWAVWRSGGSKRQAPMLAAGAVVYGLALATKFTALFMLPFVLLLAIWAVWRNSRESERHERNSASLFRGLIAGVLFLGVSLTTVWMVYLAIDPQLTYEKRVTDDPVGITETVAALLPMPSPFRDGLRLQLQWDESGRIGFLFGEKYMGGRASFYPATIALKSPLALLVAFAGGLAAWFKLRRRPGELGLLMLVPFSFLLFAMTTGTNLGIRHILIVPLFMALLGGAVAAVPNRVWQACGAGLGVWALIATWGSFPSHLAYINGAFGGSDNAYRLVGDSNVDWGQDLVRLRTYLETHKELQPVYLAYFGQIPVEEYGLAVTIADPEAVEEINGTLAISVSKINNSIPGPYDDLVKNRRPFAQIGHSILLYRISPPPGRTT